MYDEYLVSHAPLEGGDTIHTTCPACGRDKLYITRADDGTGILYNCFKSSCELRGRVSPSGAVYPNLSPRSEVPQGNPYDGDVVPLLNDQMEMLNREVGFTEQHFNIARPHWSNASGRVAFPILSPQGQRQGWVLRSYDGVEPKALSFLDKGATRLSHYRRFDSSTTMLVEDIPSAVRGSLYMNTVSLLGTSVKADDLLELVRQYEHIVICLDNDAIRQAVALRNKIDLMFERVDLIVPRCDLKDMTEPELKEFLNERT